MFLQKMTQHVDSGTCLYTSSRAFRAVPVCFGDDIGIPVCHFVRCRKHPSHSVFSVHKTMCNLCHSVLPFPVLSHAVLTLVFVSHSLTCR